MTQEPGHSTAERDGSSRSHLERLPPLGGSDCLGLSLVSYSQDFHMGLHLNLKTCGLIFQSTKKAHVSPSLSGTGQELGALHDNHTARF